MTKIAILGSGLMGPAAAYNALSDPDVTAVLLCDREAGALEAGRRKLAGLPGAEKLTPVLLDLADPEAASRPLAGCAAALSALPHGASPLAIRTALRAGVPLVDLARPEADLLPDLRREVAAAGGLVVLGCGVEPGLTEIMARYLAEKMDRVDEVHIQCGGIPERPAPPLGYKIVFGGETLPLREQDALVVEDGRLVPVPRYSGVEPTSFPGVGECEAWHEGFMPWLLELPQLQGLRRGTQKTVRWPGYAARVSVLKELGLLGQEPVLVDGVPVVPKRLLDRVLYPHVRMDKDERDITVLRVVVHGEKAGRPRRYQVEMVDRYDPVQGFTSMARTTSFTGAIVARMIARGELQAVGAIPPEQVVTGPLLVQLVQELARLGVRFDLQMEKSTSLEQALASERP